MMAGPASLGEATGRVILLVIWIIMLMTVMAIIGAALYAQLATGTIPDTLKEWGGICLGFIFGALFSLLKERT